MALLIPAYNQKPWDIKFKSSLETAFAALKSLNLDLYVVFVDDGSSKEGTTLEQHIDTLSQFREARVFVMRHSVNRGQGATLMTALQAAQGLEINADYFVTLDADGQHDPNDIFKLYTALKEKKLNIVFGNRFGGGRPEGIPFVRELTLKAASLFETFVTGLKLTDAHNGFRLFDRKMASVFIINQDRMAHATQIKQIVAREKLAYGEVPVTIHYSAESIRNGQKGFNAVNILRELLQGWIFQ